MKTAEFQEQVLKGARKLLKKGDVTAKRLAEIAKGALDVSEKHPRAVSKKSLDAFLASFPECGIFFKKKIEEAEEKEREEKIKDIRSKIARTSS